MSRRRLIAGISSVGLGALVAASAAGTATALDTQGRRVPVQPTGGGVADDVFAGANACTLTVAATEGPFYFDADRVRSDIREDRPGRRLRVALKVQAARTCAPVPQAVVEVWQCDALGAYSGFDGSARGGDPPTGTRYLRGAQVSDAAGAVEFTTVWPGWYPGRCVHIHAMVHIVGKRVLTTQLMFDEKLNDVVLAQPPYTAHTGNRVRNERDGIFRPRMLAKVTADGDGYLAALVFTVPA